MNIRNLLISVVMLGMAVFGGIKAYMYFESKAKIDAVLLPLGRVMEVNYEKITTSIFGPVAIHGLRLGIPRLEEDITFGEVSLQDFEYEGELSQGVVPRRLHVTLSQVAFDVSLLEKLRAMSRPGTGAAKSVRTAPAPPGLIEELGLGALYRDFDNLRELGYERLLVDVSIDLRFDPKAKSAMLMVGSAIQELADISLQLRIADMADNINSAVLGVKLQRLRIEFVDDSYTERMLKMFALQDELSLTQYRADLIGGLDARLSRRHIKVNEASVGELKRFLASPDRLTITMEPYRPVGVNSIKHYKAGDVPRLLNLQILSP